MSENEEVLQHPSLVCLWLARYAPRLPKCNMLALFWISSSFIAGGVVVEHKIECNRRVSEPKKGGVAAPKVGLLASLTCRESRFEVE